MYIVYYNPLNLLDIGKQLLLNITYIFVNIDIIMPVCTAVFDTFLAISCDVLYYS